MKNKKSQFLILSTYLLILLLIFISFEETKNTYIYNFDDVYNIDMVGREICEISINSNGSFLDSRYLDFTNNLDSYCSLRNIECTLNITKSGSAPTNLSLLNYSFYTINLVYNGTDLKVNKEIIC